MNMEPFMSTAACRQTNRRSVFCHQIQQAQQWMSPCPLQNDQCLPQIWSARIFFPVVSGRTWVSIYC